MYLNPDRMTNVERTRIDRWMQANGCRDYVAAMPIVVRGKVAEYVPVCRRERVMASTSAGGPYLLLPAMRRPRRLRIRIPLSAIP